jgi:VanZ family protein
MLPLRYPARWRAANLFLLVAVFSLTVIPAIWTTAHVPQWPGMDKWLHGLTFAVLAIWFTGQYARHSYWLVALGLFLYGALIEVGQSMIPYRTAEWGDLVADLAGILAGLLLAIVATGGWSLQAENWVKNRFG